MPRVWNLKCQWHFFYQKLIQFVYHKNLKTVEILETSIFHQSSRFPWHGSALHKCPYFFTQCDNLMKFDVKSIRSGVKYINCIHEFNYLPKPQPVSVHGLWGSFPLAGVAAVVAFQLVVDHLLAETVNIDNKQYLIQEIAAYAFAWKWWVCIRIWGNPCFFTPALKSIYSWKKFIDFFFQ